MKTKPLYFISTGAKGAQYTLRYQQLIETRFGPRMDEYYICNLGIDLKKAQEKALDLVRYSHANPDSYELELSPTFKLNKYGEAFKPWEVKQQQKIDEGLWPFGKHYGTPIADAPASYILFWANQEFDKKKKIANSLKAICTELAIKRGYFERLALEEEAWEEHRARMPKKIHLGVVGERIRFENLRVEFTKAFDTMYGTSFVNRLSDPDGNVLVYFGTADVGCVGDKVSFTAKVHEHSEYQGTPQTILKRPTKIKVEEKQPELQPA